MYYNGANCRVLVVCAYVTIGVVSRTSRYRLPYDLPYRRYGTIVDSLIASLYTISRNPALSDYRRGQYLTIVAIGVLSEFADGLVSSEQAPLALSACMLTAMLTTKAERANRRHSFCL